jgi:hypothetical protein
MRAIQFQCSHHSSAHRTSNSDCCLVASGFSLTHSQPLVIRTVAQAKLPIIAYLVVVACIRHRGIDY